MSGLKTWSSGERSAAAGERAAYVDHAMPISRSENTRISALCGTGRWPWR